MVGSPELEKIKEERIFLWYPRKINGKWRWLVTMKKITTSKYTGNKYSGLWPTYKESVRWERVR